eukprot:COSAG01_NODE_8700_length_2692_cov_3.016123_2_plen_86_part_00
MCFAMPILIVNLTYATEQVDTGPVTKSWCLPDDDSLNRGTVRPWEPAVVAAKCGGSGNGQVFFDTELGALRSPVDTTGLCFGVCA